MQTFISHSPILALSEEHNMQQPDLDYYNLESDYQVVSIGLNLTELPHNVPHNYYTLESDYLGGGLNLTELPHNFNNITWDHPAEAIVESSNTWNTRDNIHQNINFSNISFSNEDLKYVSRDKSIKINGNASTNNKLFPFNHKIKEVERTVNMVPSNASASNDATTGPNNIYTIQPSVKTPGFNPMNEFDSVQNYDFSSQMLENSMEISKARRTTTVFSIETQSMSSPKNTILQESMNENKSRKQESLFHIENVTSHHPLHNSIGDNFMCLTKMENHWWSEVYLTVMIIFFFFVPLVSSLKILIKSRP